MSNDTDLQEQVTPGTVADRAKLFRGLADPSRLAILEALRPGPLSVGQIVAATGLSQPNASNHLRCLSECGLVAGEARGRFVDYRLADLRIPATVRFTPNGTHSWGYWQDQMHDSWPTFAPALGV